MSEYDYDGDEEDYDDYEWTYIEDHYDDADDLAEHTCPSPISQPLLVQDYDPYDYWEDLANLSDAYYDHDVSKKRQRPAGGTPKPSIRSDKRIKTSHKPRSHPVIVWMANDHHRMTQQIDVSKINPHPLTSISLFKDWRKRFKNTEGLAVHSRFVEDESVANDTSMSGEGFDLGNIQDIAGILASEDSMKQLKDMLRAKGLASDALDAVIDDLLNGREPSKQDDDMSEHDEQDDDYDGDDKEAEDDGDYHEDITAPVDHPLDNKDKGVKSYSLSMPHRSLKRKQSPLRTQGPNKRKRVEQGPELQIENGTAKRKKPSSTTDETQSIPSKRRKPSSVLKSPQDQDLFTIEPAQVNGAQSANDSSVESVATGATTNFGKQIISVAKVEKRLSRVSRK